MAILFIAVAIKFIRIECKIPAFTATFLITNLLFTCVAEEAFFRGFIQERLIHLFSSFRFSQLITVLCSAVLFGIAHMGGGSIYTILAMLTGLGYAYSYAVVRRIEAPILIHFLFNATHFIFFTYPKIQY